MEPVHLHNSKLGNNLNLFLLLIPAFVLFLILFIFLNLRRDNSRLITTQINTQSTYVLGEEDQMNYPSEGLDNSFKKFQDDNIK